MINFRLLSKKIDDLNASVSILQDAIDKLVADLRAANEKPDAEVESYKKEIKELQVQKERQAELVAEHEDKIIKLTDVHFNVASLPCF